MLIIHNDVFGNPYLEMDIVTEQKVVSVAYQRWGLEHLIMTSLFYIAVGLMASQLYTQAHSPIIRAMSSRQASNRDADGK
jgi:hypothetical protein